MPIQLPLIPQSAYKLDYEHRNQVFNKFVDIRGDLVGRDPLHFAGDHYGSWYRLWTLMGRQLVHGHTGFIQNNLWLVTCQDVL